MEVKGANSAHCNPAVPGDLPGVSWVSLPFLAAEACLFMPSGWEMWT